MPGETRLILGTHDLASECNDLGSQEYWVPFAEFRWVAELLRQEATGYTLEFTSDDGFASDFSRLMPWLVGHGLSATFFVPAAFVGRPARLTARQLREMLALGMRIGAHGTDHLDWTRCSDTELAHEVAGGKRRLEDMLGAKVEVVAPPYGAYDRRVYRAMVNVGFSEIYTCRGGFCVPAGKLRSRVMVQSSTMTALLALGRRGPRRTDALRSRLHELEARVH